MKNILYRIFGLALISIILLSCEKKEIQNNSELRWHGLNVQEKNELIASYAYLLAKSLKDNELRGIIKREAELMFDGDYDILSDKLESIVLKNKGISVKEFMFKTSKKEITNDGEDLSELIKKVHPNLQVSVPVHCANWDTKTYVPKVAYLPCNYDEQKADKIIAYDHKGNLHTFSPDIEPSRPVIVVSRSERVTSQGHLRYNNNWETADLSQNTFNKHHKNTSKSEKNIQSYPSCLHVKHGNAYSVILQWQDIENELSYEIWRMLQGDSQFLKLATTNKNENIYIDKKMQAGIKAWYKVRSINPSGYSSWSPIMSITPSERNYNEFLKIKRMKFSASALKAVEKWPSGAPEIRLRIVKGAFDKAITVSTISILEPARRSDINNQWWNKKVNIFPWLTDLYGPVLTFDWREEDPVDNVDFTIAGFYEDKTDNGTMKIGGSIEFKDNSGADHIGTTTVVWWQEKDHIYELSGFQWQFTD
jgi:hypothetical protein